MTQEQIISKLTAVCARAEHCKDDMLRRMQRWQVDEATQREVISYLVKEKYIDEERYARFFINDKIKYNRWGRRKVEQALYFKHIPREVYEPLLDDVANEDFESVLLPLLQNKEKSLKYANDYEKRMKLLRFAMQRGFSYEQADKCINML
ncbi:MAG: RecX family transcriptional regulator [Prevotella sp.]|jgi:regulatory protein|nr:RecX family transcriptional regulator [Prevotella sp.]